MEKGSAIVFESWNPPETGACRTYFIGSRATREAALVDPVLARASSYLKRLGDGGFTLRYVIDTHTHADHVSGGRLLTEKTGALYAMHKKSGARHVGTRLTDGAVLSFGDVRIEVIETPGHTRDSITLKLPGRILTGDWLFIGSAGRTDLPGGDPGGHWESLTRVIPALDESILVCPGHDYENQTESTLSAERRSNVNLKPRSREEYVAWLTSMARPTPDWMIETIRANNEGTMDPTVDFMPKDAAASCLCQPALPATPSSIPAVSVDEVRRMAESGEVKLLLDVRQPDEFESALGHVPGATLIPLPELPARLGEIERFRGTKVVAICRSGARSLKAAEILVAAGFSDVVNMTGGTLAWSERGFPVER